MSLVILDDNLVRDLSPKLLEIFHDELDKHLRDLLNNNTPVADKVSALCVEIANIARQIEKNKPAAKVYEVKF